VQCTSLPDQPFGHHCHWRWIFAITAGHWRHWFIRTPCSLMTCVGQSSMDWRCHWAAVTDMGETSPSHLHLIAPSRCHTLAMSFFALPSSTKKDGKCNCYCFKIGTKTSQLPFFPGAMIYVLLWASQGKKYVSEPIKGTTSLLTYCMWPSLCNSVGCAIVHHKNKIKMLYFTPFSPFFINSIILTSIKL